MSVFETLQKVNVNGHTEKKNGLTYLSWAWAWGTLKQYYPDSYYTIYEGPNGCLYHTDGKTCWVKTGVTVDDGEWSQEMIEYLPVMDFRNNSIPVDKVTSFDANKAIQRSLTKAIARHGLGLYIYAGEDLPTEEPEKPTEEPEKPAKGIYCDVCGKKILDYTWESGRTTKAQTLAQQTLERTGKRMCGTCYTLYRAEHHDGD